MLSVFGRPGKCLVGQFQHDIMCGAFCSMPCSYTFERLLKIKGSAALNFGGRMPASSSMTNQLLLAQEEGVDMSFKCIKHKWFGGVSTVASARKYVAM